MSNALTRPAGAGTSAPPRPNAVVAVLALAGIVVSLMQTLVIPIVPELPKLLNAPASDTAWAVTATLLAASVATPVVGRLGDMFGKRRMLLVSIVLLVSGSVVCALADSLTPMIIGRALQGLAAAVVPLGISIMRDALPADRLAGSTALMSASLGVGGALGLPSAAFIADNWDWHILFWVSAALGVVALVLVVLIVPESKVRAGGRFDLVGSLGLAAGLMSLLLAVSKGGDWGWTSGTTLGLGAAAVVILLAWGWWELRTPQPLVDLRTTVRPQVLFTNLASIALGFSMFAMSLVLPQLLQLPEQTGYGLGKSMLTVGLVLAPQGLVMMVMSAVSAKVTKAKGPKVTLMIGALIVAGGYGLNLLLMSEVWHLVLVSCVIGAGIGFTYGALPALIMGAVDPTQTGAANSLNTLMRSLGTSFASALAGVILAQMTTDFGGMALPSENGFKVVMAIGAGAALLAFALASFIPRRRENVRGAEGDSPVESPRGAETAAIKA
ncbi:MFS transporter [Streptomyces turgidiscabies]|uniref:Putative membrane protein n=1 Tax=Streptomyces turgidiscabies (strain Car8) TaxID=698760 RepID=L7F8G0_STRT8|nr:MULTISPECIES: MFS transporter [Streptomyces]ELP66960.1 putative membrane protein [Streptomyces turgidiscabies Car8]MDX3492361.1 MFS transporter [Streptomyces turgidiscabies]GAQ69346.1 multidrug resistance protein 3 [Streptomyces turgidiscabies]